MNIQNFLNISESEAADKILQKRVHLSFDDNKSVYVVNGNTTTVKLLSYLSDKKFSYIFDSFGLSGAYFIEHFLTTYGYKYNKKAGRWETFTVGVSVCDERDTFDEKRGRRVATTKAKAKAFNKAKNLFDNIYAQLTGVANIFLDSYDEMNHLHEVENNAIPMVMNTGYCDPKKN